MPAGEFKFAALSPATNLGNGSDHHSAKFSPLKESHRQFAMLDPKTMKYTFVDTCFETHHLQFDFDKDDILWTGGGGPVVGWLDTKVFDETGDAAKAQGWTALVLDTDGNGKRNAYVEPDQPVDPNKDKRIPGGFYAIMPSPVDCEVWGGVGVFAGKGPSCGSILVRIRLRPRSPRSTTCRCRALGHAAPTSTVRVSYGCRSAATISAALTGASAGSAERAQCHRRSLPGGMGLLPVSGPGSAGIGDNSAEASYYTWVNQHNTLGLGNDVPISTGNENNALSALVDGKWVVLRVPYPLSFYAKGLDGRIDDPNAGWKGRGVWTTSGDRAPRPKEGGKGTVPVTFHFEFRPTPLTDFAPACRANPLGKPGAPRRAVPGSRCSVGLG